MDKLNSLLQQAVAELERLANEGKLNILSTSGESIRIEDKENKMLATYHQNYNNYIAFFVDGKNETFGGIIEAKKEENLKRQIAAAEEALAKLKEEAAR